MKIAYCILVHKNPEQVSRLVERLYSPSDYFYINIFSTKETPPLSRWKDALQKYRDGNLLLVSRYKNARGTFLNVKAVLDGMNHCSGFDYDYFINLSGQCYPIKPPSLIKEELERTRVAYLEYFKLPSKQWEGENGGLDRIGYYYITFAGLRIRIPRTNSILPYGLEPYGGSNWLCLPKTFVNYVLNYVSSHPKVADFYRHSWIPEEQFFQTVIMNSTLRSDVVNDDKRYIRWKQKPSPEILTKQDFDVMMSSGKLFARKFDTSIDRNILDLVDSEIQRMC